MHEVCPLKGITSAPVQSDYPIPSLGAQSADCDVTIRSEPGVPSIGQFTSPNYPLHYNDGMKCMIKFVGQQNERVQISFQDFNLNGFPNRLPGVSTGYVCASWMIDQWIFRKVSVSSKVSYNLVVWQPDHFMETLISVAGERTKPTVKDCPWRQSYNLHEEIFYQNW